MSSSDKINEEKIKESNSDNFFNNLQTDDTNDFVWVMQGEQNSCDSNIEMSNSITEVKYEEDTDQKNVSRCDVMHSTISHGRHIDDTDFIDDFSYDRHLKQYDAALGKVHHGKKTSQQRLRQRQVTFSKKENSSEEYETESSHPAFNMFDDSTTKILKSIISVNSCHRGWYGKIIGKGTNSVVIHAGITEKCFVHDFMVDKDYGMWCSSEHAVKVYKLCEDQMKNERIFQRVQKEKEHLLLLTSNTWVPEVARCSRNVIVMNMLGDHETAPSLTSTTSSPLQRLQETYQTIIDKMDMWYNQLHLVHGKLCSKNILYWDDRLYYIGWSHSVRRGHPHALKKLMRDCHFITKFFEKRLVQVKSTERLFKDITGLNKIGSSVLTLIDSEDLWKSQHLTNPNRAGHTHTTGRNSRFKV